MPSDLKITKNTVWTAWIITETSLVCKLTTEQPTFFAGKFWGEPKHTHTHTAQARLIINSDSQYAVRASNTTYDKYSACITFSHIV